MVRPSIREFVVTYTETPNNYLMELWYGIRFRLCFCCFIVKCIRSRMHGGTWVSRIDRNRLRKVV